MEECLWRMDCTFIKFQEEYEGSPFLSAFTNQINDVARFAHSLRSQKQLSIKVGLHLNFPIILEPMIFLSSEPENI